MCPDVCRTGIALLLLISSLSVASLASAQEMLSPGEPIAEGSFTIDSPKDWNRFESAERGSKKLHLIGDGKGLPLRDEKGGVLQIGLSVERFPGDKSIEARVDLLKAEAGRAPGRTLVGEIETESVKLDGGSDGTIVYAIFDKLPDRKSLYEKLVAGDPAGGTWVVTGWIVANSKSTLPRRNSVLE